MYWSELWHRDNHRLDHNLHYNQYDSDNCNTANPGGGLSCYTILFTQLGIPSAGIALVISIELLMDAFLTACNLAFLQTELVLSAKKLNLLDEEKLRK